MPPVIERIVVGGLQTNCYLLKSDEELAVIDPGADESEILERLAQLGGVVKFVINTHGHIDHVAANGGIVAASGAELMIHELDAEMLADPEQNLSAALCLKVASPPAQRYVRDGDVVRVGQEELRVLHTPGHTPGSICLLGSGYVFTGDTLFVDSIGRVDLPGGSEAAMRMSLVRLQALLRPKTILYPGHGEPGSFSRASLVNPFLGGTWLA